MANDLSIRLDLNDSGFLDDFFALQKLERLATMDTLQKLRRITWLQLYADNGLRWEKITSVKPPKGVPAVYSLRITRSCRATAFRDGNILRFLTIRADHDAAYGKQ